MDKRFEAVEWASLTVEERVLRCRIMAKEAAKLAEGASPALRHSYRELERNWNTLGDEVQHELKP